MSYQPEHDLRPDHVPRWNVVADTELTIVWAERFCRLPLDSSGSLCGRTAPFSKVENLRTHVRRHITQDPAFFGTFRIKDRGNPGRLNMKEKRDGRLAVAAELERRSQPGAAWNGAQNHAVIAEQSTTPELHVHSGAMSSIGRKGPEYSQDQNRLSQSPAFCPRKRMKMEPTVTKFSNPEQQNIVIETTNNSGHEPGVSLNVAPRPDLEKLPPRRRGEGSTAGDIFKVELFDESEGSLYGVSPQPEAHIAQPPDHGPRTHESEPIESHVRDSLSGEDEAVNAPLHPRAADAAADSSVEQLPSQRQPRQHLRMPLVIRRLPPPPVDLTIPDKPEEFTFRFLLSNLRGSLESSCCYHFTKHTQSQVYPVKAWYAVDSEQEPFMPTSPGRHGAKLTLFMPETSEMDDFNLMGPAALFVKREGSGYLYFGTYRQPRYSDRLSYSEMELEVPESVKLHRAQKAGKKGKPKWMVQAMKDEKIVSTNEDAEAIEPEDILRAFETADTDFPRGLRLYWEYFECIGYDRELYDALVAKKKSTE